MQNANIQDEQDGLRHEEAGAKPGPLSDDPRSRAGAQARRWSLLTLFIPILAILPLFSFQAARMWADPARAYFPLVFLFVGLIVGWQLKQAEPTKFAIRRWIAIVLMALAAIVFAWAVWSFSPWWAQVAGLVVFAAWALGTFGNLSSGVLALWTACLGTSLTLPFGWEQALPNALHQFAAWCCSKCLDGLGVPHLWVGNLLELRDKIIVIDDACGAWSSVYALAFVVLALIIVQKRSMFVAVLSILFIPLWVVVADFIQLSAITYAHENSGRDLASGWDFLLLDLLTFAFSVLCAGLFSKTLSVLFEPVPVGDAEFGPLFASMNRLLCWPQPDPLEDIPPTDSDDLKHFQLLKREKLKRIEAKPKLNWWENLLSRWSVLLSCGVFVLAAALPSAVIATGKALPRFSRVSASAESLQRLEQISLPEKLGEWNLLANDLDSEEGIEDRPRQLEWQYQSPKQLILLQVSHPFLGWSDPARTLERRSWKVGKETILFGASDEKWPIYEAELENDLGGLVYLYASFLTDSLQPFTGQPDWSSGSGGKNLINVLDILGGEKRDEDQVTLQIRMVCETGEPLTRPELQNLQRVFDGLRQQFAGKTAELSNSTDTDDNASAEEASGGGMDAENS